MLCPRFFGMFREHLPGLRLFAFVGEAAKLRLKCAFRRDRVLEIPDDDVSFVLHRLISCLENSMQGNCR